MRHFTDKLLLTSCFALVLGTLPAARGAALTWDAGTDRNWNTTTPNWTGATWSNSTSGQATFGTTLSISIGGADHVPLQCEALTTHGTAGSVAIELSGAITSAGTYHLIACPEVIGGTGFPAFRLATPVIAGYRLALVRNPGFIDLVATALPLPELADGVVTVALDPTFPQALRFTLQANGATLEAGDRIAPREVRINGTAHAATVSAFDPSATEARYTLEVPGFGIQILYRFTVAGGALIRSITGITGPGEPNVQSINLDTPIIRANADQPGASAAFLRNVNPDLYANYSGSMAGDTIGSVTGLAAGSWDSTWCFVSTSQAVGTAYNNLFDYPFTVKVATLGGVKCAAIYDRDYNYRFKDIKPGVWFESKTLITGDSNENGVTDWQDGALWVRDQLPPMLPTLADHYARGGAWQQSSVGYLGNTTYSTVTTPYPLYASQMRKAYHQTDGVPQAIACAGWTYRGHDWMWADWDQVVNSIGGAARIAAFSVFADTNLAMTATATASSNSGSGWGDDYVEGSLRWGRDIQASRAMDGAPETYWRPVSETAGAWLQAEFSRSSKVNRVFVSETGNRVSGFKIQYWDGASSWLDAHVGTVIASACEIHFPQVETTKVRLWITAASAAPMIAEFAAFAVGGAVAIVAPPANLATGGAAIQSTTYSVSGAPQVASRASDGNTDGEWSHNSLSCTANGSPGWWEVDMLSPKAVAKVSVWWRNEAFTRNRNVDLVIYDSPDPATRVELRRTAVSGSDIPPNPTVIDLGTPVRGQVVRLEHTEATDVTDPNDAQLCLAEVVAEGVPGGYDAWAADRGLSSSNDRMDQAADADGSNNLIEFALGGDPLAAADAGVFRALDGATVGTHGVGFVLATLGGAVFSPGPGQAMTASLNGITYQVEASADLADWDQPLVEVSGVTPGLTAAPVGYEYHRFEPFNAAAASPRFFVRVTIAGS